MENIYRSPDEAYPFLADGCDKILNLLFHSVPPISAIVAYIRMIFLTKTRS